MEQMEHPLFLSSLPRDLSSNASLLSLIHLDNEHIIDAPYGKASKSSGGMNRTEPYSTRRTSQRVRRGHDKSESSEMPSILSNPSEASKLDSQPLEMAEMDFVFRFCHLDPQTCEPT